MFQLIAGPCVIESEEMVLSIAARMKTITDELEILRSSGFFVHPVPFVFKGFHGF